MSHATRSRIPFAVLGNNQVDPGTDDAVSLEVYPPSQVVFTTAPGDNLCYGQFDLINSSSLARFAFKVKSTAQKGVIRVTPVTGVVEPKQTVKVEVTMLHTTIGYTVGAAGIATNTWLGHRILVQSVEVPKNCADLDIIWSTTPWRSIQATKLDCVFPLAQRRAGNRPTLTARTAVSRRVAQMNGRATTVTGGILVGRGAAMTMNGVTQRRMRKNVTVASQTRTEHNPWAATVNTANQNDWGIVAEDKENAAAGEENAWGAQNAWAEDGGGGNVTQDNAADNWGTDNNAAAATDDAWGTDQNNGAAATAAPAAADDWGNTQNDNNNDDWGANDNDGGDAQVNDNAWGFDNNAAAATAAVADDGWAVDSPAAAAVDNAWPGDNNNALVDANAWNNGGETAWNNDNYSAAAGDYGAQGAGANMTFNHGRVIVAFKGIQDIVFGILVVLFIGLIIGKIF